ncbi:hypothetical protein ABS71_19305 [bacterium SCN 62-11]|nr:hypothetical protein [Candidatus Eremiobacteraeota bacterium]ODT57800.1 MAG: hypothetical protein ABS71_19305 [bacterium SCN 62-11]
MQKTALLCLLLGSLACAQPPFTRTQTQRLSRLQGPAYDQEVREIQRRAQTKLVGALTQQSVDALAEWFLFATALIDGQTPSESAPGSSFLSHLQQVVVRAWPRLSPETQKKLLEFPAYWANTRRDWTGLKPDQQQQAVVGWRNALTPLLKASGRQELARACLTDLQSTYRKESATPIELQQAQQRVETAARRLAADGDAESKSLARQLQNALIAVQAQQDQQRALQEIEARKARLSTPPGADYNRIFRQINSTARS